VEVVSEEPQPVFSAPVPVDSVCKLQPESAPKESLCYNAGNSFSSRNAGQNVWGRLRRERAMLRL